MIDINKQVSHWSRGANEDFIVAKELIERGRIRHGLFFAHLAIEKILKSHVCRHTNDLAPPVHNLGRLAEKTGLNFSQEQIDLLAEVNEFNIEGRYPELSLPQPREDEAISYLKRIEGFLKWSIKLLEQS